MSNTTTRRIAELNDLCRKAPGVAGRLFQTSGIDAFPRLKGEVDHAAAA